MSGGVYLGPYGLAKCLPNRWPLFTVTERFEPAGAPFAALLTAQQWVLLTLRLDFGPPDGDLPVAVMQSRAVIPRWSKLGARDLEQLVGVIYAEDEERGFRNGAAVVRIKALPGMRDRIAVGGRS